MAFLAPIVAFIGANAAAISATASIVGAATSVIGALHQPKVAKQQAPVVAPLPDASSPNVRLQLMRTQQQLRDRSSFGSTLVSGTLGDTSAPPIDAPLVFGRT